MKNVLITGGAGFIGSQLTATLLSKDIFKVISLDNFDPFYDRKQKENNIKPFLNHKDFRFIEGDIRSEEDLQRIGPVHIIIHLAAKAGVRPSIQDPLLYQDVNVRGTQNLLEYAKKNKIKQFIFASSSSVYGVNKNVPWDEEQKLLPISPYASSKLANEMLGHVYSHLYGIRFISLRFFTVYGPGQRPDLAIYKFFEGIIKGKPITVFGDGKTSRDYTFIGDIINGIMAALDYSDSDFEIINLGNSKAITLDELIHRIESTCGAKAIVERRPEQPGDVSHTYAAISKAQKLLGYKPNTTLDAGLKAFHEWLIARKA